MEESQGAKLQCAGQDRKLCTKYLALTQLSCGIRARDVEKNPHSVCGESTTNIDKIPNAPKQEIVEVYGSIFSSADRAQSKLPACL